MLHHERIKICSSCKNRSFEKSQGMICGLNMLSPNFDVTCPSYIEDLNLRKTHLPGSKIGHITVDQIATQSLRLVNAIIDMSFIFLLIFLIYHYSEKNNFFFIFEINPYLISYLIIFLYYTFFESMFSQTPGKMVTQTKILTKKGEKPSLTIIAWRSLCRLIPFEQFTFLTIHNDGWHDRFSETKVVSIKFKNHNNDLSIIDDV